MRKKIGYRLLSAITLSAIFLTATVNPVYGYFETSNSSNLSDEQKNSIAMLNYLTVLTAEINASQNSRLYLEDAYSALINNTNPGSVNTRTQAYLNDILDTIERYRMVDVKREQLQYIYEQNQAQSIRSAIPDLRLLVCENELLYNQRRK